MKETELTLDKMIETHYGGLYMGLEGEIYFADKLSIAEITMVERFIDGKFAPTVYLPCAGTLRHVPPLVARGVKKIVAVDLSLKSLQKGLERYRDYQRYVEVHHADVRDTHLFVPPEGFSQVLLLGNSFGDVPDLEGHQQFIEALARSLAEEGILVFDYVGTRYNPPLGQKVESVWEDTLVTDEGEKIPVWDKRSRELEDLGKGMGILRFSCELIHRGTGMVLDTHNYQKLVIPDDVLEEQFRAAGLLLKNVGRVVDLSPYHRERVNTSNDLGMMGEPDCLYIAVKKK